MAPVSVQRDDLADAPWARLRIHSGDIALCGECQGLAAGRRAGTLVRRWAESAPVVPTEVDQRQMLPLVLRLIDVLGPGVSPADWGRGVRGA
jgi:hypothetical protein